MASPESDIADALVGIVSAVAGINTVTFDRVKASVSDYLEHEVPAVQIYDIGQSVEHQRGRILVSWALSLELVMKSYTSGGTITVIDQKALWDKRREIQQAIWDKPNLGLPTVVHSILNGNITDLHMNLPYYIARIDFDVQFYDDLTGAC